MNKPMTKDNSGPAFPVIAENGLGHVSDGMSLRDWFAGMALQNSAICTGTAPDWDLVKWFGKQRTGITRAEIVSAQAYEYADAMLAAREVQ